MILTKIFLLILTATAGNGYVVGNGGNTVVCPGSADGEIFFQQSAILDVFNAKVGENLNFKKLRSFRGQPLETAFPKAVALFLRHSTWRQKQVMLRFADRSRNIRFVDQALPLGTSSVYAALRGCHLEQAAIQYSFVLPNLNDQLKIDISAKIWKRLATDQKIALLFHEYILKDFLVSEGVCSYSEISNRVGFLLSDEAVSSPLADLQAKAEFRCYSQEGGTP